MFSKSSLRKVLFAASVACLLPASGMAQKGPQWLNKAVFYQIYPDRKSVV